MPVTPNLAIFAVISGLTFACCERAVAQRIEDFTNIPKRFEKASPSGGPSRHVGAAVCIVFRGMRRIAWLENNKVATCEVQMPVENNEKKEYGPTPVGEYLIGQRYRHLRNGIDWYNLYPRKEDNSGYYAYDDKTNSGRSLMGLHAGTVSLGCVTIKAEDYDRNSCWSALRTVLDKHSFTYGGSQFAGFLYVVD